MVHRRIFTATQDLFPLRRVRDSCSNSWPKAAYCAYATLEEAGDTAIAAQTEQVREASPALSTQRLLSAGQSRFYHALQPQIEALWDRIGELRAEQDSAESK